MKITRDGKTYELTATELQMAHNEVVRMNWRSCLDSVIEHNAENLRFNDDYTLDDFIKECMDHMEDKYYGDDYEDPFEDIVFDVAESNDIWVDDTDEGDDDEEECDCF